MRMKRALSCAEGACVTLAKGSRALLQGTGSGEPDGES